MTINDLAPRAFTLRQLQYVVAVAESLGFRRAAERCRVSQPSLSAQLARLEELLGVRLFERDRRRVILTPAGKELLARARGVLREATLFEEAARLCGDPSRGSLRVGVIATLSPYLLPSITPRLRARFPSLAFHWVEGKTGTLLGALEAGELDAVLLALEAEIGEVAHEVIAVDPFVLAVPPGHSLGSRRTPVAPADLRGVDVLLLDDGHCLREQALAFCSRASAHEHEFRATSLPTLVQMVAGGSGVTLLPEIALAREAELADIALREFRRPAPHRTVALAWRRRSPLEGVLRGVAGAIREAYPKRRRRAGRISRAGNSRRGIG